MHMCVYIKYPLITHRRNLIEGINDETKYVSMILIMIMA